MFDMIRDWADKKVEELDPYDKHLYAKAFCYGIIEGIPEGLAIMGLMAFSVAIINLLTGKGWRV